MDLLIQTLFHCMMFKPIAGGICLSRQKTAACKSRLRMQIRDINIEMHIEMNSEAF